MMSADDAKLLRKKRPSLLQGIGIESSILLAELEAREALTQQQKEIIQGQKGNTNQVDKLLDILLRGDANTMDKFIYALRCSGHKHLVKTYLRDPQHHDEWDSDELDKEQEAVKGPTAQELQHVLRSNVFDYIKNDPSRILKEAESTDYINQPLISRKIEKDKRPEKIPAENVFELLEHCSSVGQRVFIYGAGGMGKSSLCRHIAKTWAEEQSNVFKAFDYVFPIPMRAIRSHTLIEVICKDTKLIPESCSERIRQELDLKTTLLILDSFEEMSLETPEINKLIRRELYPKSSVLITARPDHGLEDEEKESTPCIKAVLQNLTEEQVKAYIISYPGLQKEVQLRMEGRFGMSFLCKPVNLWLLCLLVAQIAIKADIPKTQTVLLNMITQRLMVAYSKKKNLSDINLVPKSPYKKQKLSEFNLTPESPMIDAPTEVKVMLEKVGQLCYCGLRDKKRVLIIDDGVLSKADVMGIGLFSEGSGDNSVTLPHPLFQEYLAALFLSVNKRALQDLLKELRMESKAFSRRNLDLSLVKLLRHRSFDNMTIYLVGLSPDVAEELSELFVLEKVYNPDTFELQHNLRYELDLLRECSAEEGRSVIAAALFKAPVSYLTATSLYSHLLLRYFDEEQRQLFLRKFYGCQICSNELIQASDSREVHLDSFGIGMIYLKNYTVRMKAVAFGSCHMPVSMLTDRLAAVKQLALKDIRLCDLTRSQFLAFMNLTSLSESSTTMPLRQQEVLLTSVKLSGVKGLNLLSPPHCTFDIAGHWSSVRELTLDHCGKVDLISLTKMFVQLEELMVEDTALKVEQHEPDRQTQWHTVKNLKLRVSHLYTDEGSLSEKEAREFLAHLCPKAEITILYYGGFYFLSQVVPKWNT